METYYNEQLLEIIKQEKENLDKLYARKNSLQQSRNVILEEDYLAMEGRINKEIEKVQSTLNEHQKILSSIDLINNDAKTIQKLVELYESEEDSQFKDILSKEIIKRKDDIEEKIHQVIPEEFARTLEDSINIRNLGKEEVEKDSKILGLEEESRQYVENLKKTRENLEQSIIEMQKIFEEERKEVEEQGPFSTMEDLDNFYASYMQKKIEENKRLEELKKEKEKIEKYISINEKKVNDRSNAIIESKKYNISPDAYEEIVDRVNKRDEVEKYLQQLELGDTSDKIQEIFNPPKEKMDEYRKKIKEYLLEKEEQKNILPMAYEKPASLMPVEQNSLQQAPKEEKVSSPISIPSVEVEDASSKKEEQENTTDLVKELIPQQENVSENKNITLNNVDKLVDKKINDIKENDLVKENSSSHNEEELNNLNNNLEEKVEDNNTPNNLNIEEKKKPVGDYGYKTIIAKLVKGLKPEEKDGKRYRASNIKVAESFRQELKSGNYLYNIVHVVPAIIKIPINFIRKSIAKRTFSKKAKDRMKTIKERLDQLPEKDVEILFKEYSNHVESERYGSGLNMLIGERVSKYVHDKVDGINNRLKEKYDDVFKTVLELDGIDEILNDKEVSEERKQEFKNHRLQILNGKANLVASIRSDYNEAKSLLSSGLHGFEENVRATDSKMSYIGYRFAKTPKKLDTKLLNKEAELEQKERQAIKYGNDEMALRAFVEAETLMSKNTSFRNGIFGKRSTGKKYYSPLAEALQYRNDPFVRDVFSTIAMFGAVNTMTHAGFFNAHKVQSEIDQMTVNNEKYFRDMSSTITGKENAIIEGMKAQHYLDSLNAGNIVGNNTYYGLKSSTQDVYNTFANSTKDAITEITTKYAENKISQTVALKELADISSNSQQQLNDIISHSFSNLTNYASKHPNVDLAGVKEAMDYLSQHPNAITDMNKAIADIADAGEKLSHSSLDKIGVLNQLPNSYRAALFGAATATALAMNVSDTMHKNAKKGKYGNEVTELVNDYAEKASHRKR